MFEQATMDSYRTRYFVSPVQSIATRQKVALMRGFVNPQTPELQNFVASIH